MSNIDTLTGRAAMTTRALSTLGDSPAWDSAVSNFLRLFALFRADSEFGPFYLASDAYERAKIEAQAEFGRDWRENPCATAKMAEASAAMSAAEERQSKEILQPMWEAERVVMLTAAPTLNAALFKAELMDFEEVWNDTHLEGNGYDLIAAELSRFAGVAG